MIVCYLPWAEHVVFLVLQSMTVSIFWAISHIARYLHEYYTLWSLNTLKLQKRLLWQNCIDNVAFVNREIISVFEQ